MSVEIKCINKDDRNNPRERITHVGGVNPDGTNWKITQQRAIELINAGSHAFFVNIDGDCVDVIVGESRLGNKYIKTENDGDEPNNLLSLRECK